MGHYLLLFQPTMTDHFDMNLTQKLTQRYRQSTKKEKQKILDEYCQITQVRRNTAVQRLQRKLVVPLVPVVKKRRKRRGPKRRYCSFHHTMVRKCWELSGLLCAERLTPMLCIYLKELGETGNLKGYQESDIQLVSGASVSTIRRIIETFAAYKKGGRRRKGKADLFTHIPINARFGQQIKEPGYYEVDFVCHTGGNNQGRYGVTGVYVDVEVQWIMRRAGWGKNMSSMNHIHSHVAQSIYHPIYAYHPDNERTILSVLFSRLKEESVPESFVLSRSRPYAKNDNAHVEQKNGDKVRGLVGHHRYDRLSQVHLLNELYRIADLYDNFFIPSQKLIKKVLDKGGKTTKRIYDTAQTPYQRLMKSNKISKEVKTTLNTVYESLSMVELQQEMNRLLKKLDDTIG